jgi:hypothetical protein
VALAKEVTQRVQAIKDYEDTVELNAALKEAERLADLYADVKPIPFAVPIERFVGLPVVGESKID